ncbi:type II secretion system F family protein [Pimelobacter sp. 30-1]|uniref:type II secretion system F family protein n=1 Tax=Pimelobacter sp. 30-1 TaxID=2004991 RepID=UPI001C04F730|nr:type II secretion system F family protein [Pimelobacter sp. 30-1]MBU2693811.1 type II secretion system protein [Pimelobacter sp. 30-1]
MTALTLAHAVAVAAAVLLLLPPHPRLAPPSSSGPASRPDPAPGSGADPAPGLLRRGRLIWAVLAGAGAAALLGGLLALPAGLAAAAATWIAATRLEPPAVRRRRDEVRRDLPHVVTLLAAALRSGLDPAAAIDLVCKALPGPAAARLDTTAARLRLGGDAAAAWTGLAHDPDLAPLGRTLARAHRTGAPVVAAVERLAADLAAHARAETEDRARAVGVRAAVPLGLCLLPAFLLLGIVPLAVSLATSIV